MNKNEYLLPRLIRLRDVTRYLGMDRHRFNKEVRQFLTEIPIGIQGIAFDRLDLEVAAIMQSVVSVPIIRGKNYGT